MSRDRWAEWVWYGKGLGPGLARAALAPLSWGYGAIGDGYLLGERLGWRKRYRPRDAAGHPVPVIVIGNITSGGTGKTPMTVRVVELLRGQGRRVAVLSRGHGGSNEAGRTPRVVSDGERVLLTPDEAGDEPVLLANALPGVPLVVCRDRRQSARFAVERFASDVLVLDDGFQHWRLYRDLDIVLLDARNPFDNGLVLPRGGLREPPSHLSRAGVVVLTRADQTSSHSLSELREKVRNLAPDADIYSAVHAPVGWIGAMEERALPLISLTGFGSWLAFSGIADGSGFLQTVRQLGVSIADSEDFGDHYPYRAEDIDALVKRVRSQGFAGALTTEKDLVKVRSLWPGDGPPLYALGIGMLVDDEARFADRLRAVFGGGTPRTGRLD